MTRTRKHWISALLILCIALGVAVVYFTGIKTSEAPPDETQAPAQITTFPAVGFPAPDLDETAAWRTYHGDANLTGAVSSKLAAPLEPYWRFAAGAEILATPVVADGRVFFATIKGQVFATNLRGEEIWSRQLT